MTSGFFQQVCRRVDAFVLFVALTQFRRPRSVPSSDAFICLWSWRSSSADDLCKSFFWSSWDNDCVELCCFDDCSIIIQSSSDQCPINVRLTSNRHPMQQPRSDRCIRSKTTRATWLTVFVCVLEDSLKWTLPITGHNCCWCGTSSTFVIVVLFASASRRMTVTCVKWNRRCFIRKQLVPESFDGTILLAEHAEQLASSASNALCVPSIGFTSAHEWCLFCRWSACVKWGKRVLALLSHHSYQSFCCANIWHQVQESSSLSWCKGCSFI